MLIEVTKDHIKNGIQECEMDCPIALAVCDAVEMVLTNCDLLANNVITCVHDNDISVYYNHPEGMKYQYNISPKSKCEWKVINDFIHRYDTGQDVEPFDMEFEVIQN